MDNKACIVEFCLEFVNLKQKDTENIAKFVGRADVLCKKLRNSQINVGIAVIQEILNLTIKRNCYSNMHDQKTLHSVL